MENYSDSSKHWKENHCVIQQFTLKARIGTDICTPMFIATLCTIVRDGSNPSVPSMDGWVNKMWSIHTMHCFSDIERKEILTQTATWMNLEDIMLNEISQSQKDKHCMISCIWGTERSQIHWDKKKNGGWQGLGGFPGSASSKEPACQCKKLEGMRVRSLDQEGPLKEGTETHSSLPGESHRQCSLMGNSPKGSQRDMAEVT